MSVALPMTVIPTSHGVIPANAGNHGRELSGATGTVAAVGPGVRRDDTVGFKLASSSSAKLHTADPKLAAVAQQFEALFVGQMLESARAAALADDPLNGPAAATFRDFQDDQRAQALAKAAPLGVAKLLAARP